MTNKEIKNLRLADLEEISNRVDEMQTRYAIDLDKEYRMQGQVDAQWNIKTIRRCVDEILDLKKRVRAAERLAKHMDHFAHQSWAKDALIEYRKASEGK